MNFECSAMFSRRLPCLLFQHEIDPCLAYSATSFLEWLSSGFPSIPCLLLPCVPSLLQIVCSFARNPTNIIISLLTCDPYDTRLMIVDDRWMECNLLADKVIYGNLLCLTNAVSTISCLQVAKSMVKTGENAIPVCANCYLVLFPPTQTAQTVTVVLDLLQFPTKSPCSRCFHLFSPFSCVL